MYHPTISIIVALDGKRALGKNNRLLWNIPEDMKHFRTLTTGHAIIMGRKTYESIGRPLPQRTNIVVTSNTQFQPDGCCIAHSLEEALQQAQACESQEVFIIGGGSIYAQALSLADRLYLTVVDGQYDADVFFPEYKHIFTKIRSQKASHDEHVSYTFFVLEKE